MWILLAGVVVVSYFRVPGIFFQQDEILGFGLFIKESSQIILSGLNSRVVMHFVPVTMSLSYSLYKLFGPNYIIYNSLSLLFHFANAILIYLIAKKVFYNKFAQVLCVIVFVSSNSAAELLMWPVINLNVISLTFSLTSLLVILEGRVILATLFFLLSILSVEYGAGFVLLLPLTYLLLGKGQWREKLVKLWPFGILVLAYCILRLAPIIGSEGLSFGVPSAGLPIYLRWLDLVPRYFGQLFFGQSFILWVSELVSHLYPNKVNEVFIEANIFPVISFLLGTILILFTYLLYVKKIRQEKREYSRLFILITFSMAFSALPFLLIPGEAGSFSIFASRYMYFGLFGLAIYVGFVNDLLIREFKSRLSVLVLLLTATLIFSGTIKNFQKGESLYVQGKMRLGIIKSIDGSIPSIPQKLVIYTESSQSYYGLPGEERIMPFQSGFGQTLLIFLGARAKFPLEFYPGVDLWEIRSQGYFESEGWGFGYFRDLGLLKKVIDENNIPEDSLYAFSWDGDISVITDISDRIRHEVDR